ncbi:hypothetical protein Y032_0466g1967 [Ancylostoma ceylanicum]|uniref:Uncharacterized protein n=1 Tax=Ancylostoma ceylanicum TaxID=53326 RepID=A0A016WZ17_9BILA|nr:hypothetical protein Y032_0466g1967 [Ancylostoma ceylanicum]
MVLSVARPRSGVLYDEPPPLPPRQHQSHHPSSRSLTSIPSLYPVVVSFQKEVSSVTKIRAIQCFGCSCTGEATVSLTAIIEIHRMCAR